MTIYDLNFWGSVDSSGKIKEYYEDDAITSAFQNWLNSKSNDYLMQPGLGGVLDSSLFRTLSDQGASHISFAIQNAIENGFTPKIELETLEIVPNYDDKRYEIYLEFINPQTNTRNSVIVYSKDVEEVVQITYQNVTYIEENLLYFTINAKTEQPGEKLIYNADEGKYYYGKYKYINLTSFDPYFNQIKTVANG